MPSLAAARVSNAGFCPSYLPVAIFAGGTAGIGQSMVESFARTLKGRAHIIIIGRNRAAAESILASLPKPTDSSEWKHEFVPCDVTLMKNVHATTKSLLERLPKINFLVLSAGVFSLSGREETEEGIDKKLASRYYSRWVFTNDFLPLLRKARDAGEDAKVMSILAAGFNTKIDFDDLGMKKKFSGMAAMVASGTYNDLMMVESARREPDIAFTHIHPGFVNTDSLNYSKHWAFRLIYPFIRLLTYLFAISPEDCAEYMLFALYNGEKGLYLRNSTGEDLGAKAYFGSGSEDGQRKMWEHTVQETKS